MALKTRTATLWTQARSLCTPLTAKSCEKLEFHANVAVAVAAISSSVQHWINSDFAMAKGPIERVIR